MTAATIALDEPRPRVGRRLLAVARWLASLRHLSLVAVLTLTAHAHWYLAVEVLAFPRVLGWTLPLAIDAYLLAALAAWEASPARRHGDLVWALGLDGAAVAGSHAASQLDLPPAVRAGVAAALGVILVLVLWRVHALDVQVKAVMPVRRHTPATDVTVQVATSPVKAKAVTAHGEVSGPRLVTPHGDLAVWVAEQRQAGRRRADVLAEAVARWECSMSTAERRWRDAA